QRFGAAATDATPAKAPADAPLAHGVVLAALVLAWYCLVTSKPEGRLPFAELTETLPPDPHLLTEDATPVVLLGQRPVVMDAFAFRLLAERGLIDDAELAERIRRGEFNGLVLLRSLDDEKTPLYEQ